VNHHPGINARAADLRERALAKLLEARDLTSNGQLLRASDQRRFDQLMAEFRELDRQAAEAAGQPVTPDPATDNGALLEERLDYYQGAPASSSRMRFPSARAGAESWGAAVLAQGGLTTPNGRVPVPLRLEREPIVEPRDTSFVHQLIPAEPTNAREFEFWRQHVRENNAAPVPRGGRKPVSVYKAEPVSDRVRVIAHISEQIPRQDLADAPMLTSFLDSEMMHGLRWELDKQIVSGDGTGENFLGILATPGIQAQAFDTDLLTTTRKAVTKLELVDVQPTAWVMHALAWEAVELEAKATFASNPNSPAATEAMRRRLHGIPVFPTSRIPEGRAVLGSFRDGAELLVREEPSLQWTEAMWREDLGDGSPGTDWTANQVAFRAEGRWGFAVKRPFAFVDVALTG
jgi:HK97 family phage major capsid protein